MGGPGKAGDMASEVRGPLGPVRPPPNRPISPQGQKFRGCWRLRGRRAQGLPQILVRRGSSWEKEAAGDNGQSQGFRN